MVNSSPAVTVYECDERSPDVGGMVIKTASNGMKFFIKVNSSSWSSFANGISVN